MWQSGIKITDVQTYGTVCVIPHSVPKINCLFAEAKFIIYGSIGFYVVFAC